MDHQLTVTREESTAQHRLGLLLGVTAWSLWGLFPLYFSLLDAVSPLEIVAHRIIWTFVFLLAIMTLARSWWRIRAIMKKRTTLILLGAATFITINWSVYVYAVTSNQIVQASLGYFINPLISVALGVLVLRERLRSQQWIAVCLAGVAVLILTFSYGALPWISITLGFSFATYGLLKKLANVGSRESLLFETTVLSPFAIALMAYLSNNQEAAFVRDGWSISLLLVLLGPVTALPLLAFGGAATRISLSSLGILQYITPVLQFCIGVFIFHEAMPTSRWIGFLFVWLALLVFSIDAYRHTRRRQINTRSGLIDELEVSEPT